MVEINQRIDELRGIYTPEDYKTFEAAYKCALKAKQ